MIGFYVHGEAMKWSQCIRQYLRELKDTVVVIDYTCTYVHV